MNSLGFDTGMSPFKSSYSSGKYPQQSVIVATPITLSFSTTGTTDTSKSLMRANAVETGVVFATGSIVYMISVTLDFSGDKPSATNPVTISKSAITPWY